MFGSHNNLIVSAFDIGCGTVEEIQSKAQLLIQ